MKRLFAAMLAACLFFTTGCAGKMPGSEARPSSTSAVQPKNPETTLGYLPEEVETPEWLVEFWGWDTCGDTIWLGGLDAESRGVVASYDTVGEKWKRFPLFAGEAHNPVPVNLSVTEDSFWILLQESYTDEDIANGARLEELGYYVLCTELGENRSSCVRVPFDGESSTESSDAIIFSIQALGQKRALLTAQSTAYLIDSEANLLGQPELPALGEISRIRVNDRIYVRTQDGYAELDVANVQLGEKIPVRYKGSYSSNAGSILYTAQEALYRYDPVSGEKTEIFQWMDVALSYREMGSRMVFENSKGEFFYPTSKGLIKITQQQIPIKQALTLVCFGDSSDEMAQYRSTAYTYTEELMDAIIRFNNTDLEYKVEIKPVIYADDAERDRLLIELATSENIDLIDTSILPENAIKDGLLVDMLPYIDADAEICREDFIEPLFNAMLKKGGLYEYTDKFTMLTLIAREDQFPGREAWTVDNIRTLMAQNELDCHGREYLLEPFIMAATAEFIDWETMSCSFDSPAFQSWLSFLKEMPEYVEHYENPFLFLSSTDYVGEAGYWARKRINADCVVSGFPNTSGTGSYFVELNSPFNMVISTLGSNTQLGILASGVHQDGAWRFVKTMMLGESEANIMMGIPVLKERFENALDATITNQYDPQQHIDIFNESDAHILREQVYNTTRLVYNDEALINIIRSEAMAYFEGQKSVQEAARQIQSRVSIYLSEQG